MPDRVSLPLAGGCHCGAIRYALTAAPLTVMNCHCSTCQKISGGAFSTNAIVREEALVYEKGTPKTVEWLSDAGNRRIGYFCGACGGRIAHGQTPSKGILSLRTGTFDDTSWVEPAGDIWTKSAQGWLNFGPERPSCAGQPGDLKPYIERFRAQGRFSF